jgi:glycosyltransferase
MKISIITPVYNDPRIELCIQSISHQQGNFEIEHIVVDSNSTDKTVDILQSYKEHIDVLIREDDNGLYDAINKGINRATGDVIGILNADDKYQDNFVLDAVANTMSNTTVDICYGDLVYVNDQDNIVRYWQSGAYKPYKYYLGWMPPHPTFFVRSELYENIGLYDTTIPIAADYDLMLRFLLKNDVSVQYIDQVLVRMTIGGMSNSSIRNMIQVIKDMYKTWDKYNQFGKYIVPLLHPLEKSPQYLRKPPK